MGFMRFISQERESMMNLNFLNYFSVSFKHEIFVILQSNLYSFRVILYSFLTVTGSQTDTYLLATFLAKERIKFF